MDKFKMKTKTIMKVKVMRVMKVMKKKKKKRKKRKRVTQKRRATENRQKWLPLSNLKIVKPATQSPQSHQRRFRSLGSNQRRQPQL